LKPTYLYIKQHSVTGKLYFGKTVKKDIFKYLGSGKYWSSHIKKHGIEHVETLWFCLFTEKEEIRIFALMCSEMWDIMKSEEWLNFKPENGLDGNGRFGLRSKEECDKFRIGSLGNTNALGNRFNQTIEARKKISKANLGNKKTLGHKPSIKALENMSKAQKGIPKPKIICPHCLLEGGRPAMIRHHFDNCKKNV
jgi:hypothetical protein